MPTRIETAAKRKRTRQNQYALSPRFTAGAVLPPNATVDGTVRRFLEEAAIQFGAHGYFGVSLREIAAPIGVKPSALYAHFESKHALLHELVRLAHEYFYDELVNARDGAGTDPADQLRAVVIADVRVHATYPLIAMVANHELRALSQDAVADILETRRACERLIEGIIELGIRRGVFKCTSPHYAMRAVGSMCLRVAAWFNPDANDVEEVARAYSMFAVNLVGGPV